MVYLQASEAGDRTPDIPFTIVLGIPTLCFLGLVFSTLSFLRNEAGTWYKWMGGFINFALILLVLISRLFGK